MHECISAFHKHYVAKWSRLFNHPSTTTMANQNTQKDTEDSTIIAITDYLIKKQKNLETDADSIETNKLCHIMNC